MLSLSINGVLVWTLLVSSVCGVPCPNNCTWDEEYPQGRCNEMLGTCICNWGYYDYDDDPVKDCNERFYLHYTTEWTVIRVIYAVCFVLVMVVAAAGALLNKGKPNVAPVANLKPVVLLLSSFMCFTQSLWIAIDPKGFAQILPIWATYVLEGTPYWIGTGIFFAVLFHWVDIYHVSITSIKNENMLKSINMNYRGREITIEEVTSKVKFLRELRLPFTCVFVSVIVFQLSMALVRGLAQNDLLGVYFYSYVALIWIFLSVGFLVYGKRLANILPFEISKKIRRMTRRVTVFVITIIVTMITMTVMTYGVKVNSPSKYGWFFVVIEGAVLGVAVVAVGLYSHFSRRFPYIFKIGVSSTSQSGSTRTNLSGIDTIVA